jgi:branched-chain amino acid transport system ATP-binding protein
MSILVAQSVTKRFGGLTAVKDVNLTVEPGEVVGLIGPNGAGKTTFFNCLTGMETPTAGTVTFRGKRLPSRPDLITKAGVARTFQNIRLFNNMTALENVIVGRHTRTQAGVLAAVGRGPRYHREERESEERALELLEFVGLSGVGNELAKSLPYGDQRRLEIARALATEPALLLLDEPTAGMNPNETAAAVSLVRAIQDLGIAVVLIEHDMRFVFGLCDRVAVLVQGEKLLEGSPDEVQRDERVIAAYLGKAPEDVAGDLPKHLPTETVETQVEEPVERATKKAPAKKAPAKASTKTAPRKAAPKKDTT